ncbi:hypothetical protein OsJ_22982 [Oryza sativa Japonica Group]|uniref:Major facilitator superfamily (MFS) profile domain-containing protein n=1 Tax=Oryza sativa subsp. japonica TaxID=39947 RepID=A3BGA4_ORYSJ|nr:hypothetical protein OsJ_22982 [Oryza sativa Japonica Group]
MAPSAAAPEIQELIHHPYDGRVTSFVVLSCVTACLGGILFGYDIGLIDFGAEKIAGGWGWRVSLAVAAVPAAFLAVGAVFLPETPNSLVQQGEDHGKVRALLSKIRGSDGAGVDDELDDIVAADRCKVTARRGLTLMLTHRRYRPQLVMAVMIPFFQQMTGINAIAFYAPVLLRTVGMGESAALLAMTGINAIAFYAPVLLRTVGMGESAALLAVVIKQVVGIGATLASMLAVDRFGRRTLFLAGGAQMLGDDGELSQASALLLIVLVAVYVAGFAWSWGPLGWLVPSEIFPLEVRSAGQSIAVAVNFLLTTAVAQSFLAMLCHMKAGIFFFFAAWLVAMTAFVYLLLPETKGLPIEQVGKLWARHWFWRRFVVTDSGVDGEEEGEAIDADKL